MGASQQADWVAEEECLHVNPSSLIDPVRKYIYIYKWKVNSNIIYLKLIISVMVLNVNGLNNATTKQRVDFSYQPR